MRDRSYFFFFFYINPNFFLRIQIENYLLNYFFLATKLTKLELVNI